jgi:hypothetical protein
MPLSRITSPFQSATANVYSPSANTIAFRTSSTDRLRINSGGNTVTNRNINVTSDNNEFAANTNGIQIQPQGRIFIDSSADWLMELSGNTTSRIRIYSSTGGQSTTVGSIAASATSALFNAGNVQLNENGLKFPASQNASADANTLDDYEEGTWTPTVTLSSSAPSVTYTVQKGTYTKVGRQVTVYLDVQWSAASGGSGDFRVTGAPFTNSSGDEMGAGQTFNINIDGAIGAVTYISGTTFFPQLLYGAAGIGSSAVTSGSFNKRWTLTMTYFAS